jgi:hypothetical protein
MVLYHILTVIIYAYLFDAYRYHQIIDPHASYSFWLTYYKEHMESVYFSEKTNFIDLLAGLFGTKLKVNSKIYYESIDYIKKQISTQSSVKYDIVKSLNIGFDIVKSLNIGFDEILLLHLFRDLISFKYEFKKIKNLPPMYFFLENDLDVINHVFISRANMEKIFIGNKEMKEEFMTKTISVSHRDISFIESQFEKFRDENTKTARFEEIDDYLLYGYDILCGNIKSDKACIVTILSPITGQRIDVLELLYAPYGIELKNPHFSSKYDVFYNHKCTYVDPIPLTSPIYLLLKKYSVDQLRNCIKATSEKIKKPESYILDELSYNYPSIKLYLA